MMPGMKLDLPSGFSIGVRTTEGRGFTPEELAQQCAEKVVGVSSTAHPAIRDQAIAFQKQISSLIEAYLNQAVLSDRTTVYNALTEAGHPDLADLIRRL
jgi:hypothetical protein